MKDPDIPVSLGLRLADGTPPADPRALCELDPDLPQAGVLGSGAGQDHVSVSDADAASMKPASVSSSRMMAHETARPGSEEGTLGRDELLDQRICRPGDIDLGICRWR